MATMMRLHAADQEDNGASTRDLERLLEAARRRRDDAERAYEAHRRVHAEVGLIA